MNQLLKKKNIIYVHFHLKKYFVEIKEEFHTEKYAC